MSRNAAPPPASSFFDELRKIPPVTRFLVGATIALTGPILLELLPGHHVVFVWSLVKKLQLWRIPTSFFLGGGGLPFLFDIIMLYRNSNTVEETWYHRRSPEYAYQLLLSCIGILALNLPLGTFVHYRAMLVCITYLSARLSPNAQVSIFGIISVQAIYFPFALVGMDLLNGGPKGAAVALTGVIMGHVWWMLEWKEDGPSTGGGRGGVMGRAPGWLVNLVGYGAGEERDKQDEQSARRAFGSAAAPRGRGLNDGGSGASNATPPGQTHSWGRGNRLGND